MAKTKTKLSAEALGGSVTHLLHRALQLALDFHAEAAGPSAITQRQYTVLTAAAEGDGVTQNDLVRATGIDRSTLADLVARMLAKGLLVRERSPTDARANHVRLSEAGREALGRGARPAAEADARLLAVLSPKKRASFIATLATLAAAADGPAPPTDAEVKAPKPAKTPKLKAEKAAEPAPAKGDKKKKKKKDKTDRKPRVLVEA
jgi:DNA-binding MarR family transcriptional regulator